MKLLSNDKKRPPDVNTDMLLARIVFIMTMVLLVYPGMPVFADTAKKIQKPVTQAIDTGQASQKKAEKWEIEKQRLSLVYDRLLMENKHLVKTNEALAEEEAKYQALNDSLEEQKIENLRIQKEIMPFLVCVIKELEFLIENDVPFLPRERKTRLHKLTTMMEDIEVSFAEKYRKVMEALSVEAEYGNTIEVYQDRIQLEENEVLGNIFRLGRVSLFFLSFDNGTGAVFNAGKEKWVGLDEKYIPALVAGVQTASKRRAAQLISLPIGRIAKQ